jgi:hypothetical protein
MGIGGEGLWTVRVGRDLYEVRNSPWHARNINWGGIVRAVPANDQKKPEFVSVMTRSGKRTIHMYNMSEEGQSRKDECIAELKRLGANPATLDYVRGNDICIQCHSQGGHLRIRSTAGIPKIEQTIKENFVSAHTFRFITAKGDGANRNSESLYLMPCRQIDGIGDERVEDLVNDFARASNSVVLCSSGTGSGW